MTSPSTLAPNPASNFGEIEVEIGRVASPLSRVQLARLNNELEGRRAEDIVRWAAERFGDGLCMTTSFADSLLIDVATRVAPDIEVIFLDTGFHFAETLDTARRALARYQLNLNVVRPAADAADIWSDGVDACCRDRKIGPLERALIGRKQAWLSGLRRADHGGRAATPIVEIDRRGLVKVNPLANWTDDDVAAYSSANDVMVNPLAFQGYPSIGCWPCTEPVAPGADPRSGRWAGSGKSECGIHA